MRCTICENPQVRTIDTLLASGSSIRQVSRLYPHSRSSVSRHKQHAALTRSKFGVIEGQGGTDGTTLEPLAEALALSKRARSDRELLKAAEAIRSATALEVRALRDGDVDEEMLEQLDSNIAEAATLYRRVGGFENELRGLAGHREAIRQRIAAVRAPATIEVPFRLTFYDAEAGPGEEGPAADENPGKPWPMTLEAYFRGIPKRFHDLDRFAVRRTIHLSWHGTEPVSNTVKVYDRTSWALVWAS